MSTVTVIATGSGGFGLRSENVKLKRALTISSSIVKNEKGQEVKVGFIGYDQESVDLHIDGVKVFNTNDAVDAQNLKALAAIKKSETELSQMFEIIDPEAESRALVEDSELELMVRQRIQLLRNNEDELRHLYRRVKGSTAGISEDAIYSGLVTAAKLNFRDFLVSGDVFVLEGTDIDKIKAIDEYLEYGVLIKNNNFYYFSGGEKVFAENMAEAIYIYANKSNVREELNTLLEARKIGQRANGEATYVGYNSDAVNRTSMSAGPILGASAGQVIKEEVVLTIDQEADFIAKKIIEQGLLYSHETEAGIVYSFKATSKEKYSFDQIVLYLIANGKTRQQYKEMLHDEPRSL